MLGLKINGDKTKYLVTNAKNKSRVSGDSVCGNRMFKSVEEFESWARLSTKTM